MSDEAFAAALGAFLARRMSTRSGTSIELSDPWRQNPFVRAAVGSLYRITKGVNPLAVTGDHDEATEAKRLGSLDPLSMLLARPSRGVYGGELWASVLANKKLDGRAFVQLMDADGKHWTPASKRFPASMVSHDPRSITAEEADIDYQTSEVRVWTMTRRDGSQIRIPSESMMVFRDYDPRGPLATSSPLAPVWLGMEADLNIDAYSRSWLANLGAIGTWLQVKGGMPSDKEVKLIAAKFREAFTGANNAGKTFVSGEDLDLKAGPTAQTAKDMEMPRLREWNRDTVKAVLGVTDFEVGRVADYNRANSESARRWLYENTIIPELRAMEDVFWGHVAEPVSRMARRDSWLRFDVESLPVLQSSLSEQASTASTLVEAGYDAMAVSEKLGLGLPVADIDVPPDTTPTAATPDGTQTPQVPAGAEGLNGAQVTALLAVLDAVSAGTLKPEAAVLTIISALPMISEPTARRIVAGVIAEPDAPSTPTDPAPAKTGPTIIVKKGPKVRPISRALAARLQREWARHAERKLGVSWRRFTKARYQETVERVRALRDAGGFAVDAALGDPAAWRSGAEAAARRGLDAERSGRVLTANMGDELALRIDVDDVALRASAARRIGQMVEVGAKLRSRIRDSIGAALQGGESLEDLEKIVQAKFGARLPSNAATVARTETQMFAQDVRYGLMRREGIDEHEWRAAMDVHTRDTHRAVDGERRALGERFSNGLTHPMESGAPASEVVNCRCLTLPYLREIED